MLLSMTLTAYAATVYYPTSGAAAEYCENVNRGKVMTFRNLPQGVMYINYVLETDRTMEIRFYRNSNMTGGYYSATLTNNELGNVTTVSLGTAGTYYVAIYTKSGSATTFSYAFDLYRN